MVENFKIFIGFDVREKIAYHVLSQSIIANSSIPVTITPINLKNLRRFYNRPKAKKHSTEFSISRFLTPYLSNYKGYSLYLDCDFIILKDVAKLLKFISKKPKGYKTFVGEDGGNLSGGQRQKIDLARVLLKDASILIFDEPTSHLDLKSRESFLKTLRKLKTKISKTIIIIAHDIQKISFVDKIIVIKNGKIAKIGSHKKLIQSKNWYSETLKQNK